MTADVSVRRLAECEDVIERGLQSFIEVANALMEIKESRLWVGTYESFDAYCQKRWDFGKRYANNLINAANIAVEVGTMVPADVPPITNERQARELAALPTPALRAEVYVEAVKDAGGKQPTGKQIKQQVSKSWRQTPTASIDGKPNDPKDKLGQVIPEALRPVFVSNRFGDLKAAIDSIRSTIKFLLQEQAGFHVNKHVSATEKYLMPGLDAIRYQLIEDGEPYCVCITCNGGGKVRIDPCKSCKGCGWLTKYKWKQIKDDAEAEASIRK